MTLGAEASHVVSQLVKKKLISAKTLKEKRYGPKLKHGFTDHLHLNDPDPSAVWVTFTPVLPVYYPQ